MRGKLTRTIQRYKYSEKEKRYQYEDEETTVRVNFDKPLPMYATRDAVKSLLDMYLDNACPQGLMQDVLNVWQPGLSDLDIYIEDYCAQVGSKNPPYLHGGVGGGIEGDELVMYAITHVLVEIAARTVDELRKYEDYWYGRAVKVVNRQRDEEERVKKAKEASKQAHPPTKAMSKKPVGSLKKVAQKGVKR